MLRVIKILLSLAIAFICIVYAAQNLANLPQALGAVGYVMGNVGHEVYPASIGPSLTSPFIVGAALAIIITLEFAAGLSALKGGWDLCAARKADAGQFDAAKRWVYIGAGLAMLVWFGLFHGIGGAFFQQWQTQVGDGSLTGAFWYGAIPAMIAVYLAVVPDD